MTYTAKGMPFGTPPYHSAISTTAVIDMVVAPWTLNLPAPTMADGTWNTHYHWQLPIQYVNGETVAVTAIGLPPTSTATPTGYASTTPATTPSAPPPPAPANHYADTAPG